MFTSNERTVMDYKIISREDAAQQNLTHFFTGRACRYGHIAPRFVSTASCIACNTARAARFRKDAPRRFSYDLHPQDVAAALAYCQALDMQRGRVPVGLNQSHMQAATMDGPRSDEPFVLPAHLAEKRAFGYPDGVMPQMQPHEPGETPGITRRGK